MEPEVLLADSGVLGLLRHVCLGLFPVGGAQDGLQVAFPMFAAVRESNPVIATRR